LECLREKLFHNEPERIRSTPGITANSFEGRKALLPKIMSAPATLQMKGPYPFFRAFWKRSKRCKLKKAISTGNNQPR
jgi:hypothetical protein